MNNTIYLVTYFLLGKSKVMLKVWQESQSKIHKYKYLYLTKVLRRRVYHTTMCRIAQSLTYYNHLVIRMTDFLLRKKLKLVKLCQTFDKEIMVHEQCELIFCLELECNCKTFQHSTTFVCLIVEWKLKIPNQFSTYYLSC